MFFRRPDTYGLVITFDYANAGSDSTCNDFGAGLKNMCCSLPNEAYPGFTTCVTEGFKYFNFSEIKNQCPSIPYSYYQGIRTLELVSYKNYNLDDLAIYNLWNGSNSLPSANITYNDSDVCRNNSESKDIPIQIDVYDPEGDTIYYGYFTAPYNQRKTYEEYNFEDTNFKDFTESDNFYTNDTTQFAIAQVTFLMSDLNFLINRFIVPWSIAGNGILLTESGASWLYSLERKENYPTEIVFTTGFTSTTKNVTGYYTYYSGTSELITNISVEFIDGNLSIAVNDSNVFNHAYTLYEGTLPDYENEIIIDTIFNGTGNTYKVSIRNWTTLLYNHTYSYNFVDIGYFKYTSLDQDYKSYTVLDNLNIFYYNYNFTPAWTTTKPTAVTLNYWLNNEYNLYVSDSYHYPAEYNLVQQNFYLVECKDYVGKIDLEDMDFNFLFKFKNIGKNLKQYLIGLGYYELGKSILWFLFVIVLFAAFFSSGFNVMIALLASSLSIGLIAYWVDYTAHFITMLVLFAFTLAAPIAKHYLGR